MKPTFALDLTRDTIGLLHRTPKGWLPIGEVAFDAPDLADALDYLRKTALGLSPLGVATKIILPNSQVLYTEIHAPGPSREEKRRQIAAALEGRTPYDVADLLFDWSGKGGTVKVAVVAKETLAEAEAFAAQHRLNPVSFVAIPEPGTFVGEPWFGPTEVSASILAEDETVERDRDAVSILQRELPKAEPVAAVPVPERQATAEVPAAAAPVVDEDDPLPGLEEALNAELPEEAESGFHPPPAEPEPVEIGDAVEKVVEYQPSIAPDLADEAPPGEEVAPAAPAEVPVHTAEPEVEEAPFAHVTDTAAFPDSDDDLLSTPDRRTSAVEKVDDDLPPAPSTAALVAFASRRNAPAAADSRPVDGVTRSAAATAVRPAGPVPRPAAAKNFPGLVTAPSIPGTRAKSRTKSVDIARPAGLGPTTVKSPARPGGTFGAAAPPRSRTGMVFLILVALLLVFLALVGAWSSLYLGGNGSTTTDAASVVEVVPDVSDEMLADMQDPEGMTEPLPEAEGAALTAAEVGELATESLPVNIGGDAVEVASATEAVPKTETVAASQGATPLPPETAPETEKVVADPDAAPPPPETAPETETVVADPEPVPPPPEPAPGTVVATDVSAAQPPVEDQDEIFLSSMDAPPPALDALALPTPTESRDLLPDLPMPPPAPGTIYQFEANGLLKPTPEGIVSPDGVMLIAGKPRILPPSRSEIATAAAQAAAAVAPPPETSESQPTSAGEAAPVTDGTDANDEGTSVESPLSPADPAMVGFRPRARPETLESATNDALAPDTEADSAFAGLRPLPRPASVLATASALRPASATEVPDLGAQGASLTAQAEAKLAAAAALEAQNPSIVVISMRPAARPRDLSRAVEAAVAAAVREPAPTPEAEVIEVAAAAPAPEAKPEEVDEIDEPEPARAAPSIPTKASVAKQATYKNAINLSKTNLIGTYGTDSRRYALIRLSTGRYKKVRVGDKIDGGTVKAITDTEVRYQKGGKLVSLSMPKA